VQYGRSKPIGSLLFPASFFSTTICAPSLGILLCRRSSVLFSKTGRLFFSDFLRRRLQLVFPPHAYEEDISLLFERDCPRRMSGNAFLFSPFPRKNSFFSPQFVKRDDSEFSPQRMIAESFFFFFSLPALGLSFLLSVFLPPCPKDNNNSPSLVWFSSNDSTHLSPPFRPLRRSGEPSSFLFSPQKKASFFFA